MEKELLLKWLKRPTTSVADLQEVVTVATKRLQEVSIQNLEEELYYAGIIATEKQKQNKKR
jgi:bifunctional DNase/RNase